MESKKQLEDYNKLMENIHFKQRITNLENIIVCLLDEIVSMSINYNIDIHDGDSNYNYYKNEFNKLTK